MCKRSLKERWRREPKVRKTHYKAIIIIIVTVYFLVCHAGVYVPVGGKKLLTFLDDLNMPAKDTFGSQPPLELIRQWIDYGFWYDRLKQTVKQIKVKLHIHVYIFTLYSY